MPGDQFAWVYIDVDKEGRPLRCALGQNNIYDPEARFRLCKAYSDSWRASPAAPSDPPTRTIKRYMVMIGYKHEIANQKARKQYFRDHPEERPECYPE